MSTDDSSAPSARGSQDPALADAIGSIRATHEDSWPRGPESDEAPEAGSVGQALDPDPDDEPDTATDGGDS